MYPYKSLFYFSIIINPVLIYGPFEFDDNETIIMIIFGLYLFLFLWMLLNCLRIVQNNIQIAGVQLSSIMLQYTTLLTGKDNRVRKNH